MHRSSAAAKGHAHTTIDDRIQAAVKPRSTPIDIAGNAVGQYANRRRAARTGFDRPGFLSAGSMVGTVHCVVRNTARRGALLDIVPGTTAADQLPECFTLVFLVNRIRSEVNCVLRWRRGREVGVTFTGPISTTVGRPL